MYVKLPLEPFLLELASAVVAEAAALVAPCKPVAARQYLLWCLRRLDVSLIALAYPVCLMPKNVAGSDK